MLFIVQKHRQQNGFSKNLITFAAEKEMVYVKTIAVFTDI